MKRLILLIGLVCALHTIAFTQNYYYTPSGEKYHKGSCRMVKNVAYETSEQGAIDRGLKPCKICLKDKAQAQRISNSTPRGREKLTTQCLGTTKKGTRCKHMTSIGNGYCFQHNPR